MKKLTEYPDEILFSYLDGKLDPMQREAVEMAIGENPAVRLRLQELQQADSMLRQLTPDQPSKNFTSSVLRRLDEYPARAGLSIRNGIVLLSGIMAVMVIAIILLSLGVFDQTTTLNPNDIDLVQQYIKQTLPSISVNGKLVVNVIIILNLALMFVVLDRAILKPLFQRRMQTSH